MRAKQFLNEDWNKVNKKDKTDGLSQKAVNAYRRENPGSKLQTAVTTKPSKLKAGSKDAKRRKSFCARMSGNKGPMKDEKGRPTPKAKALSRWNCESVEQLEQALEEAKNTLKDNNPCWKGYKPVGTKKKGGKTVPNCVPVNEDNIGTNPKRPARPGSRPDRGHEPQKRYVTDRKTGKQYDPDEEFEKKMNSPEVMAQMKRMAQKEGVAEGLPQTLRKVVPGYAKREIDKKMDAGKFGKTDADKDANFQRYKKIQDKLKEQGVAEGCYNESDIAQLEAELLEHKKGVLAKKYTKKPVNPAAKQQKAAEKAKEKLQPIKPMEGKASRELCKSSKPDEDLGASMLASCKSQGLRARDGEKSHKLGKDAKSRVKVGGHRIKGRKYGGPLPDWS